MTLRICWFRHETIGAFEELRRYFQRFEAELEKTSKLERYVVESRPTPDQKAYNDFMRDLQAHEREFRKVLPRIAGYSFVILLYAETEFRLKQLCSELKKRNELPLSVSDLHGGISERVQKFFKAFSLAPLLQSEMATLADLTLVRNAIVHGGGMVSDNDEGGKLMKLVARVGGLVCDYECASDLQGTEGRTVCGDKRLSVSLAYCLNSLTAILTMFRRLFDEHGFVPENMTVDGTKEG